MSLYAARLVLSCAIGCLSFVSLAAKAPQPALPDNDTLHKKLEQLRAQSAGEPTGDCRIAIETNHRYGKAATTEQINTRLFEITLKPGESGVINGIKLPNTEKLRVLGVTLKPKSGQPVTVDVRQ